MDTSIRQSVHFQDLGKMDYQAAWDYQEQLLQQNVMVKTLARNLQDGVLIGDQFARTTTVPATAHHLLFVEHPPVYTLGKSGHIENVLISETEREQKGISFFRSNRGGDITFHGPEQLVGYPIFDLECFGTDIGKYLRNLEEVVIRVMADYGLSGERSEGETGVWLDPGVHGKERKICAIGVRCSRWITMHGFALNVNTDLSYFNYIIPCGIQNKQVTSLQHELGRNVPMEEVKERVKFYFEEVFGVTIAEAAI